MRWPFGRRNKSKASKSEAQATLEQLQGRTPDTRSPFDEPPRDAVSSDVPAYGTQNATQNFAFLVEDVFVITGRGCVVTGEVTSGAVIVGQQVTVVARNGGRSEPFEVSSIEAFRSLRETAQVGEVVGLLLPGLSRDQIGRGDQVIA